MSMRYSARGRMRPRDPSEPHRVATPLELLFDLTFVVAVARVANVFAESLLGGHQHDILGYLLVFFAIWWAWMNFTWFASAYDSDDAVYRVLTLLQMVGVLILAAGVDDAFGNSDFTTITVGYVVMRTAMVAQWLRAAAADPERRKTNRGYALGIFVVQVAWVVRLFLPDDLGMAAFFVLIAAELAVPLITEQQGATPWHPHHVAERYGLFTIIVLGECVTAASLAMSDAFTVGGLTSDLVMLSVGGLLLLFGMWWVYFMHDTGDALDARQHLSYVWGYSHYFVFAAAAAVGGSLEAGGQILLAHGASLDHVPVEAGERKIAVAVALTVSVFLLVTAFVHTRLTDGHLPGLPEAAVAATALLALGYFVGDASMPVAVLLQGVVVATFVGAAVMRDTSRAEL